MSVPAPRPSRSALGQAAFQLWLLNVVVGTLVGSLWLVEAPEGQSLGVRLYVSLALVSSVATLALVPGGLFFLALRVIRPWRLAGVVLAVVGSLFLVALYSDTVVYRLLRYHFNGAVLNVAFTPGSGDAVYLGSEIFIIGSAVLFALILGQFVFWRWRVKRALRREQQGLAPFLFLQPRVVCLAFFLPLVGIEKSVYAAAEIIGDRELVYASAHLPGPKMSLASLLELDEVQFPGQDLLPQGAALDYPHAHPVLPEDGPRPNYFVLVLDSWRQDAFTAELTPNLWRFAEDARVFEDHLSGGNGTRHGLFSMLYGLHGSYWFQALKERRSSVLIETLQRLDYDVRVFSAASMSFPEFRQTAWVGLPQENVIDRFQDEQGRPRTRRSDKKDEYVAEEVEDWLAEREARGDTRPYFCFVLLDSPHQPYFNPGGPHQPDLDALSYLELGVTPQGPLLDALRERIVNTYKNCVVHADRVSGRLLESFEKRELLEESVVLVTGDHGEEFYECGYWGHTSNFSPEQLAVPCILRAPGLEPRRESRPTSHLDVSGSLLEWLGADPERHADYSLGERLLDPLQQRERVVAGWSDVGLLTETCTFRLPLLVESGELQVYGRGWRLRTDVEECVHAEHQALEIMVQECRHFLRLP